MNSLTPTRASTRITGLAALMIAGAALFATTQESQAREAVYVYDVYYAQNGQWVRFQSYFDPSDATRALQYLQTNYPKLPRTWSKRFYRWSEEGSSGQGMPNLAGTWKCTHHGETQFSLSGPNCSFTINGYHSVLSQQGNTLVCRWSGRGTGQSRATSVSANRITWDNGNVWYR